MLLDGDIIRGGQELLDEVALSESTCNRTVCLARMSSAMFVCFAYVFANCGLPARALALWSLFGGIMGTGRGDERFDS